MASLGARDALPEPPACPEDMTPVDERVCIDRYEAATELLDAEGRPAGLHPHNREIGQDTVRAVSRAGLYPQGHVSRDEAASACEHAGKRLCTGEEWRFACRGRASTAYPYGPRLHSGDCNDEGVSPLRLLHGAAVSHDYATMNDPRLLLLPGTVARTGLFSRCRSENGALDMVGNLHEWTSAPSGVFRGGYFLDTTTLGIGCDYQTTGHAPTYRDYSTGFRCCQSAR